MKLFKVSSSRWFEMKESEYIIIAPDILAATRWAEFQFEGGTSRVEEIGSYFGEVKQDGSFMKAYYTQTNPNGMPPMKEMTVNKKKVWDKSDVLEFLEGVVDELNGKVSKASFETKKP